MQASLLAYARLSTVIATALAATPAFAQETSASPHATESPAAPPVASVQGPPTSAAPPAATQGNDGTGGDIIVTANKRSQSLNNVGLSITAATGEQLAQVGVRDTGDLAKITPGLQFAKSQEGTPVFTLRGVGFNDYTLGASPAVSVYVDQVPLAYSVFTKGAVLDLERVEVLKGPQGLLFGQNSTGGAINYIANKPNTDRIAGGGGISFSRFNTLDLEGYVTGPISDTLAIRMSGATTQSGPWQRSVTRNDTLGRQNFLEGRLQLQWNPSSAVSVLLSVNGWRDQGDTQAAQLVGIDLQQTDPGAANPAEVARRIAAFRAYPLSDQNARTADWDSDRSLKHDDGFVQTSLRADFRLGSGISLTALGAYSRYDEDFGVDRDGTDLKNAGVNDLGNVDSYYGELRLAGDNGPINWILGANYAKNKVYSANDILTGDSTNTAILPGVFIRKSTTTITQDIRDTAVFGNVEFKLTNNLTLLGGARYTDSRNHYTSCMRGDAGMQATFGFFSNLLGGTTGGPVDETTCLNLSSQTFQLIRTPYQADLNQTNTSWRGGINYKPTKDVLLYALASRGYKSGSFPTVPASTTGQFKPVTQESVTAYEAGFKVTALDRALQVNGAAFHYDYINKQVRGIIIDPIFNQLEQLVNIPKSRINGAELEVILRPVTGLTLHGGFTYIDSKVNTFTGINNNRIVGNYAGSALPFSPKTFLVGDVNYEFPIDAKLRGFVGSNALHNSSTNSTLIVSSASLPDLSRIRAFTTVDVRAGIKSEGDTWTVSIWGRNIFNTYYWSNQFVTQDVDVRYAARPVTYGATLKMNF